VAPLQASTTQLDYAYYLVYPKTKGRLKQVRAFAAWVTAEAQAHEAALQTMDVGAGI
jgi:LysR family transcriptional regulator, glycine cleavage system transcriptional activator